MSMFAPFYSERYYAAMSACKTDYAAAGVSIARGNELTARIKNTASSTARPGVMGAIGGFGGLFDLAATAYRDPVLVSGTDGVGTKIKLAIDSGRYDTIGIDLVAMCVNDVIVSGAEPLFFLDYFACSSLDVSVAETVITGIARGCQQAGCALIGGETAEMPGLYRPGDYDLAGFCVGVAERAALITGEAVCDNDLLLGLPSSGAHANGYALIRKIMQDNCLDGQTEFAGQRLLDVLLQPTRIYVREILALQQAVTLHAVAHITGGGMTENLPRVLPADMQAEIDTQSWQWPGVFSWLQATGNIDTCEMYRTFNCGIGMVVVISADDLPQADAILADLCTPAIVIGRIGERKGDAQLCYR